MKKLVFLFAMIGCYSVTVAQNGGGSSVPTGPASLSEKGNGKITGFVQDADTKEPVEFATVALALVNTEKPIDGTVCDEKGKFTISKIEPGTYSIIVSFIGYETQTIAGVTISDKKEEANLGIIKLVSSTKILNEV